MLDRYFMVVILQQFGQISCFLNIIFMNINIDFAHCERIRAGLLSHILLYRLLLFYVESIVIIQFAWISEFIVLYYPLIKC